MSPSRAKRNAAVVDADLDPDAPEPSVTTVGMNIDVMLGMTVRGTTKATVRDKLIIAGMDPIVSGDDLAVAGRRLLQRNPGLAMDILQPAHVERGAAAMVKHAKLVVVALREVASAAIDGRRPTASVVPIPGRVTPRASSRPVAPVVPAKRRQNPMARLGRGRIAPFDPMTVRALATLAKDDQEHRGHEPKRPDAPLMHRTMIGMDCGAHADLAERALFHGLRRLSNDNDVWMAVMLREAVKAWLPKVIPATDGVHPVAPMQALNDVSPMLDAMAGTAWRLDTTQPPRISAAVGGSAGDEALLAGLQVAHDRLGMRPNRAIQVAVSWWLPARLIDAARPRPDRG